MNENKKKDKSNLKKFWLIVLLFVGIPPFLYWLLNRPLGFNAIGGDKAPQVWLSFLGGYIGAAISALVAFYILDKQIESNKKENNETRDENKKQNNQNRLLQLAILEQQQELQWLNEIKKISIDYIRIFNNNDLIRAQNALFDNPNDTYEITRKIMDGQSRIYESLRLLIKDTEDSKTLLNDLYEEYKKFYVAVCDIHALSSGLRTNHFNKLHGYKTHTPYELFEHDKDSFSEIVRKKGCEYGEEMAMHQYVDLGRVSRLEVIDSINKVRELLHAYIDTEQERVGKILVNIIADAK